MAKSKRILLGLLIVVFVVLVVLLDSFFDLKSFQNLHLFINSPQNENRDQSYKLVSMEGVSEGVKRGIVARINSRNNHLIGVWVWHSNGLKYYKSDENIAFSSFRICEDSKWAKQASIKKEYNLSYEKWQSLFRQGDYIEIFQSDNGVIKELVGYDWWVFVKPLSHEYFEKTCQN